MSEVSATATPRSVDAASSLTDLLGVLLDLRTPIRAAATRSLDGWTQSTGQLAATAEDRAAGDPDLWLIDTRDREARSGLMLERALAGGAATLVLTGVGRPGSALRRMLRRVRRPGTHRMRPARIAEALDRSSRAVTRLSFEDGPEIPTEFSMPGPKDTSATGTAFLVTSGPPFGGPLWEHLRAHLGDELRVRSFQLRDRGAAVVLADTPTAACVIRVVPPGPLQAIVRRNHSALEALRSTIASDPWLLDRMPTPLLDDTFRSNALFAESRLQGTLAWKVAGGACGPDIHRNAIEYLSRLRAATLSPERTGGAAALLQDDEGRIRHSECARRDVLDLLTVELDRVREGLATVPLQTHASHGDFGYGNILVDPGAGAITGVIDWDTARIHDLPGIDRVNLEIQIQRTVSRASFSRAVRTVWERKLAADATHAHGAEAGRALFAAGVCRYVTRALNYPVLYKAMEGEYLRALRWMADATH